MYDYECFILLLFKERLINIYPNNISLEIKDYMRDNLYRDIDIYIYYNNEMTSYA